MSANFLEPFFTSFFSIQNAVLNGEQEKESTIRVRVTPIVGVCNCSMFCCTFLYVHSSIAIILMGKRELIALLNWSSWCLVMVERLFLAVPRGCLQFVIVVFPDHIHLLFWIDHRLSSLGKPRDANL